MDPVLDMDHEFDNRGFVAEMDLNAQFMGRFNKTTNQHEIYFLALDRILRFHNLDNQLKKEKVRVIEIKESDIEGILKFNRVSAISLANSTCDEQAKEHFANFIRNKISFVPDIVVYWEECNEVLKELFPNTLFLQGSHTGLSSLEKCPDVVYTIHNSENINRALYDTVNTIELNSSMISEIDEFKEKFKKELYIKNQISREWLDPEHKFKKIIFYPGNFESYRFKRYSKVDSNEAVLTEILNVLPKDYGLVFTKHPLDKTSALSNILRDDRVINLTNLSDFNKEISFQVMPFVDGVVNVYSNIYMLAYIFDKPVFSFGNSPNTLFSFANYKEIKKDIDTKSNRYLDYVNRTFKTLYYHITRKVPLHFLRNSRNANSYIEHIYKNKALPILNTVQGYSQQIFQTRLTTENPLHNYVTTKYDDLVGVLLDDHIENIGFDVFDTLVVRPFIKPTDLFQYIETKAEDIIGDISHNFASARQMAEKMAREGKIEVTLDEIYSSYEQITGIDYKKIESLKSLELQSEYKFCYSRESIKNIFNLAKIHGKQVFIASDMYLSRENIKDILLKCGYDLAKVSLFVSSEFKAVKHNGTLFKKIITELDIDPAKTLFIGDNLRSDVNVPTTYGMRGFHYPKPIERYTQLSAFLPQNLGTLLKSGLVTHHAVIANKVFDNPFIRFDNSSLVNNSAALLGYSIFGPLILSLISWLTENLSCNKYDEIIFCSRDSKLINEIYDEINERFFQRSLPVSKYIYISRTATLPAYCNKSHLLNTLSVYNTKHNTEDFLKNILKLDLSVRETKKLIRNLNIDLSGSVNQNATGIIKLMSIKCHELFPKQVDNIRDYFNSIITSNRVAMFDLGTRGTSRDVISHLLGKKIDLYLFRETFYKPSNNIVSYMKDSFNPFRRGLRTILPQFYEQLISDANTCTCSGYERINDVVYPVVDTNNLSKSTQLVNESQHYVKLFYNHYVEYFDESFSIINCQSRDIMLFPVSYLCSGSSDLRLLSQFVGDDPFWSSQQFSIIPAKPSIKKPTVPKDNIQARSYNNNKKLIEKLRRDPDLYIRDSKDNSVCKLKPYLRFPIVGPLIKKVLVTKIEKSLNSKL